MSKGKKGPGRPFKELDAARIEALASRMCTNEEIAADQNVSSDTITRNYAEAIKRGHQLSRVSLRAKQFELAMGQPGRPAEYLREHRNPDGTTYGDLVRDAEGRPIKIREEVPDQKPVVAMCIFLGKQYLNQADTMRFGGEGDGFEFVKK